MRFPPLHLLAACAAAGCAAAPARPTCPPAPCQCPPAAAGTATAATAAPAAPPALRLTQVTWADLPGWADDDPSAALEPFQRSCRKLTRKAAGDPIGPSPVGGLGADWRPACAAAARADAAGARAFFEAEFVPFAVSAGDEPVGRFTGYYEPLLHVSRRRGGRYQTPLWGRPSDLIAVKLDDFVSDGHGRRIWGRVDGGALRPYPTRAEIDGGALKGKSKPILWGDDPVDVFVAQVQGSALVAFDDGSRGRIEFAGKNGRTYTAIGRVLVSEGELESGHASLQEIRAWLAAHPERRTELLHRNDGFVFFALASGDGPRGSQGVVLTPERSIAVDRAHIPLGAPIWVDTEAPVPGAEGTAPWRHLLIAQDTGGGIRGFVRGDIFWGPGAHAEEMAGRMNAHGRWYLLLPAAAAARARGDQAGGSSSSRK